MSDAKHGCVVLFSSVGINILMATARPFDLNHSQTDSLVIGLFGILGILNPAIGLIGRHPVLHRPGRQRAGCERVSVSVPRRFLRQYPLDASSKWAGSGIQAEQSSALIAPSNRLPPASRPGAPLRLDVLVDTEQIIRVVLPLYLAQSRIVIPIAFADALISFVHQKVNITTFS